MKFSIIVPVYNTEKYIKQCIESVIAQSYQDWELLLIDDGSPDNCPIICDEYASSDKRIKVIHKKNGGASDARNYGIKVAVGDYIMFMDADDWWDNNLVLNNICSRIEQTQCDILIFGMKKYYMSTKRYENVKNPYIAGAEQVIDAAQAIKTGVYLASACDKVVKLSLIYDNNLYFKVGQLSEDIEWAVLLLQCATKISVISEAVYVYRQHKESKSHNVDRKHIADIFDVIAHYSGSSYSVNTPLQNFIALQYILLICTASRVNRSEIEDIYLKMRNYWYLLDYNEHPTVHFVSKFKFIGFNLFYQLVRVYMAYRK